MQNNINVPYLLNRDIAESANSFRDLYGDNDIPVDVERIIETKLGMEIIPIPELRKNCDMDASVTSNWKYIYVDNDSYLDDRYYNRLRFSLAHELGHCVLHRTVYESFNIKSFEDVYDFAQNIDLKDYNLLEHQANKFANMLLVPLDILVKRKKQLLEEKLGVLRKSYEDSAELLNKYVAGSLCDGFGVSSQVIEIALKRRV